MCFAAADRNLNDSLLDIHAVYRGIDTEAGNGLAEVQEVRHFMFFGDIELILSYCTHYYALIA